MASNFRSWPTFATIGSSSSGFSAAQHLVESREPGSPSSICPAASGTYHGAPARRRREREARRSPRASRSAVGQHAQGEPAGAAQRRRPAPSVRRVVVDDLVLLLDGVRRRRVLHRQRAEPEAREQLVAPLARRAAVPERVEIERAPARRCGSASSSRLCRASSAWASSASRYRFCGTSAGVASSASSVPYVRDQIARALLADAGHALDVVDRCRPSARARRRPARAGRRTSRRTPSASNHVPSSRGLKTRMRSSTSWKKSLSPVTIATSKPVRARPRRQRADHVVGLEPLGRDDRHAERFAGLVHPRDLLGEIVRHGGAVRLVVGDESGRGMSARRDRTTPRCTPAGDPRSACAASSRSRRRRWWTCRRGRSAPDRVIARGTSASCRR